MAVGSDAQRKPPPPGHDALVTCRDCQELVPLLNFSDRQRRKYVNATARGQAVELLCPACDAVLTEKTAPALDRHAEVGVYCTLRSLLPDNGLRYIDNFLSTEEEWQLVELFDSHRWEEHIRRRQQFWGVRYFHTADASSALQPDATLESDLVLPLCRLDWLKEKLAAFHIFEDDFPSQVLVQEYRDNTGISSHFEDFDAFGDVIVTINLCAPILFSLVKPSEKTNSCQDILASGKILLEQRSLLVMAGEARNEWRHGIGKSVLVPLPDGGVIRREGSYRRISLTIRHLLSTRRRVAQEDLASGGAGA